MEYSTVHLRVSIAASIRFLSGLSRTRQRLEQALRDAITSHSNSIEITAVCRELVDATRLSLRG